jgi:tripartite ATP-independent transporter DctM subunit
MLLSSLAPLRKAIDNRSNDVIREETMHGPAPSLRADGPFETAAKGRDRCAMLERALLACMEPICAALLVVEIAVTAAGVVWRYIFDDPLVWTDELSALLFVWLSMLGAILALGRGEHMRMGVVMQRAPPLWQRRLNGVGHMLIALMLLTLFIPAWQHFQIDRIVTIPSLGISDGTRSAALVVGIGLLMLLGFLRLARDATFPLVLGTIAILVLLLGVLHFARPALMGMGNFNLVVFFVVILSGAILIGVPIAFSFLGAAILYLEFATRMPLGIVVSRMEEGMSSLVLLAIPLFVYLGLLIEMAGLTRALVDFMAALVGHVRGGLSYVLLGAVFLVSGISGSKAADMAAVAPGLIPEMKRRGAMHGELAAQLAASAVMTETIPPSLVLIMIGSCTGVSMGALFRGGLLPAVICTAALVLMVFIKSRRAARLALQRAPLRQILRSGVIAFPALILPVLIRTAVTQGIATATEVSTVGVLYTWLIAPVVYRRHFDWKRTYPVLVATASLTGAIMLILGAATVVAWALTQSGFAHQLVAAMTRIPGGAAGFLAISIVGFVLLGSVLEGLPAILVFAPLLLPVARALGIDEVHYSMVIVIAMGLGLFAPPLGVGFYTACAIARVAPDQAMRSIWPYLGALLVALVLIAILPWLLPGIL